MPAAEPELRTLKKRQRPRSLQQREQLVGAAIT